jgi:sigma-B regulation protein RsbU (phosphoserine phosphatase)
VTSGPGPAGGGTAGPAPAGLLEESAEDLYENAPCGYLSTRPDGQIIKVNGTLLAWLGYARDELVGRRRFADLLTAGGRIYHETHFAPLLAMQGELGGVALDLKAADGTRLPVLVTSVVRSGPSGEPLMIRTTVFDARDRRAYERELLRARQESERERDQLRVLVTTLQRSLLPNALPAVPGLDAAAHYRIASADEVSGDFYDLFPLSSSRWGLFLGDVCGKGAHAAARTSLIRYTLRAAAAYDPDPGTALATLNGALHEAYQRDCGSFCSAIVGLLTPDGDGFRLDFANGGHPEPLLLRADGTAAYQLAPRGLVPGILEGVTYTTATLGLRPGDTLVLYTDGLTEARPGAGRARYGDDALLAFAGGLSPTTATAAVAALSGLIDSFAGGVTDDTAILALSVPAPAGLSPGTGTAPR